MRATEVLQKCLHDTLDSMHALRRRVLLRAVEAMIQGSRLTLIDLARSWPGAMCEKGVRDNLATHCRPQNCP